MAYILDENGSPLLDDLGMWIYDEWGPPFPDIPLDIRVEVNAGGTWTDLSARLDHPPVIIARGHPDESATVAPSTVDFELTNSDAVLSPDNPTSSLYPFLVQNIPGRVSIPEGASYMRLQTDAVSGASSGTLAAPADIDAQVDMTLDNGWTQGCALISQWVSSGNDRCWYFALNWDGTLQWGISTDGTMGTYQSAGSTLPAVAPPGGRMSARVTWNHTTGVVTFFTSTTPVNASPTWTQLGATVTLTPASPLATASAIEIGMAVNTDFFYTPYASPWPSAVQQYPGFYGKCHGAVLITGATVKAAPDFTTLAAGTTSFTDSAGITWTLQGTSTIDNRNYRCHAELAEWPQDEPPVNPAGGVIDATVKVTGGGLLRRYSQRNQPVQSAYYRGCQQLMISPGLAACWPMEDAAGSQSFADITGGLAMSYTGTPTLASNSSFLGSNPLPVMNGATFSGRVRTYAPGWTDNVVRALVLAPAGGDTTASTIMSVRTNGTVARADLTYGSTGTIALALYNAAGTNIASLTSLLPFGTGGINGQLCRLSLYLQASGGNIIYAIEALRADGNYATSSGSIAGSIGAVLDVQLNAGGLLIGTVIGGVTVQPLYTSVTDMAGPLAGWVREPAGSRMSRLCAEDGIPFRSRGNLGATTLLGAQTPQTFAALMQSCADADLGTWTELRQALGFGYTCRNALYNQAAIVAADYGQDHLSPWTSPPQRDDLYINNDVTYSNSGGSSARQFAAAGQPITGGRFAIGTPGSSPPSVGTYDQSYPVAIAQDSDLNNLAGWRLHLGTVDQARFPGVVFDLSNRALASQFTAVTTMDLGHRFTIANPPLRWGTGTVTQLAQQVTETLGPYDLEIAVCGIPELPYEVFQIGTSHLDTDGTTLTSGISATAPSESFTTASGFPLWSVAGGDYPVNVMQSGELVTVGGVGGGSSPQTASSVTRAVNQVSKAQSSGTAVNVWPPPVLGL